MSEYVVDAAAAVTADVRLSKASGLSCAVLLIN